MNTKRTAALLVVALVAAGSVATAQATELLTNGGFEGGDFTGWTVTPEAGSRGTFYISTPGSATPNVGFTTAVNAAGGVYYAVFDEQDVGAAVLLQGFTVAAGSQVTLSFQMFVNNWFPGGEVDGAQGLDFTDGRNQQARVDILTGTAGAFDTGSGVLANLYHGAPYDDGSPNPYTDYSFDLTPWVAAGGSFQLRFAAVDNYDFFNLGVDNVSIERNRWGRACPSLRALACSGWAALALACCTASTAPVDAACSVVGRIARSAIRHGDSACCTEIAGYRRWRVGIRHARSRTARADAVQRCLRKYTTPGSVSKWASQVSTSALCSRAVA